MSTNVQCNADEIRRLLGEIEQNDAQRTKEHALTLRVCNERREELERERHEFEARIAQLQARYNTAVEIIGDHLADRDRDRAREMVEREYRVRRGLVEEVAP
jgi:hypothetical protein